ncbi:MAG: hypothetical protein ICCCNLDF_01459 [Planctomycetes bacterium]|nr:hypothetical protein [Planctomycetota bacterium]
MEFMRRFPADEACFDYLVESRWPDGFVCPECGWQGVPYWIATRRLFECRNCRYQVSPTAGTVLHRTRIPLHKWFWAAYLVATLTPGISGTQLQRQLGLKRNETAFMMLHRLRAAMVRQDREKLRGVVEVDEAYIGGKKKGKAGRGAAGKTLVIAAVERSGKYAGRVRLKVIPTFSRAELHKFIRDNVEPGSTFITDGLKGYTKLEGYTHLPEIEGTPERAAKILPHVHRVFSNLKSWLIGTHHGVSPQHLQAYLNEFAFRFNRRNTPMAAFQTLLGLTPERLGPTYKGLISVAKGHSDAWRHPNPRRARPSGGPG